ncbi:WD40 repeat-like protein [Panus rudis PR-1116 ss-1]|nr:WD40 repeat-like protein [Panus rudis PR-1116 ss-1]
MNSSNLALLAADELTKSCARFTVLKSPESPRSMLPHYAFSLASPAEIISNNVERSFLECKTSCISCWDCSAEDDSHSGAPENLRGIAVGCQDGSFYVFTHLGTIADSERRSILSLEHNEQHERRYMPLRYPSRLDATAPRSPSPSPGRSGFNPMQPSKSRVVSGISTEQAEAPKNYVDFDEEPERLKGMLKGKPVKHRPSVDSRLSEGESSSSAEATEATNTLVDRGMNHSNSKKLYKSRLSATASPSPSATTLSSPPSPAFPAAQSIRPSSSIWALRLHVLPPRMGPSEGVSAMRCIENRRYLVCLHQSGRFEVISTQDGYCLVSGSASVGFPLGKASVKSTLPVLWNWQSIRVLETPTSTFIALIAGVDVMNPVHATDPADGNSEVVMRVVVFELEGLNLDSPEVADDKVADVVLQGYPHTLSMLEAGDGHLQLLYMTPEYQIIKRSLAIDRKSCHDDETKKPSSSNTHLPLPNPFKALTSISADNLSVEPEKTTRPSPLGEQVVLGNFPISYTKRDLRISFTAGRSIGLVWSDTELLIVKFYGGTLLHLATKATQGVLDVAWKDSNSFVALYLDRAELYALQEVTADNDLLSADSTQARVVQVNLLHTVQIPLSDTLALTAAGDVVSTRLKRSQRRLELTSTVQSSSLTHALWKGTQADQPAEESSISAALPLKLNDILLGYGSGYIRYMPLAEAIRSFALATNSIRSDTALPGRIVTIHRVVNPRSSQPRIIVGSDDGGIAIYTLDTLRLLARWTVFVAPLVDVVPIEREGRLDGRVFCVSEDGSIAVVAIDECQFLYLIPPSISPIVKACIGEDNLLLYYADGRARLWDTRTREFWRCMSSDKADEMLSEGGWFQWNPSSAKSRTSRILSALAGSSSILDGRATLTFDLEAYLIDLGLNTLPLTTKATTYPTHSLKEKLEELRTILAVVMVRGIDENIDRICEELIGTKPPNLTGGMSIADTTVLFSVSSVKDVWSISSAATAIRALAIISILQTMLQCDASPQLVDTVVTFYSSALGETVGPSFKTPSLPLLARVWIQTTAHALRHASQILFEAGVARLSDEEIVHLIQEWQNKLPSLQSASSVQSSVSATALLICGHIASHRYALLASGTLTDVAKSIALYLHDETSPYRALAIDLCSRGFPVWQQYVDAVQMLRALFVLATTTRKDVIGVHNVGLMARSAILHIASTNTPLFMTTLSIDILQPRNVQHRRAVMQLVIFLIRKKPLVLYSNLPRLVEAVVKSLDPSSTASRDAVLDSATEILGHIVQSFPTVDFHMSSQRLAVGTSEGAVVMYDLKTATRLYVLEGHKKRTTACSFSPDGRRLVTMSLEESIVLVWKVGTSLSSFFYPGAPPRQGHSGSEPFKTLNFNVGDEGHMTLAETLEYVRFEWPAERSVKLRIRESILTFST